MYKLIGQKCCTLRYNVHKYRNRDIIKPVLEIRDVEGDGAGAGKRNLLKWLLGAGARPFSREPEPVKKILKMALGSREPGVRPFKREPEQETVKEIYKYRTQEPRYF